jgi:hypothetical protein
MMRTAAVITVAALLIAGTILGTRFAGAGLHASQSDIIFAHANHTDVDCTDCHPDIERSADAQDRNFPSMDVCSDCHDVEDECGTCHRQADNPEASPHPARNIVFGHQSHLDRGTECTECHGAVATSTERSAEHMPTMRRCFACHDGVNVGDDCELCHADHITLVDIHPLDWRHQHGAKAALDRDWCAQCHREEHYCLDCHRGDNLTGDIHDLNYLYTHGLDAKSKRIECMRCHDNRTFCNACHERENRIPLLHSTIGWLMNHGGAARRDVESCASCHDSADPTCARSGCHNDFDGVRGTDPRYHASRMSLFSSYGPWHDDGGYTCFECHRNTRTPGVGFCGYCHDRD